MLIMKVDKVYFGFRVKRSVDAKKSVFRSLQMVLAYNQTDWTYGWSHYMDGFSIFYIRYLNCLFSTRGFIKRKYFTRIAGDKSRHNFR